VEDAAHDVLRAGVGAALDDHDLQPGARQRQRGRRAGRPRPDDDDVDPLVLHRSSALRSLLVGAGWEPAPAGRPYPPRTARSFSVSFGASSCTSPTMPKSAILKIGASGSRLIATIVSDPRIPTVCWTAPETPRPMYSFGAMVLPVWPTCS